MDTSTGSLIQRQIRAEILRLIGEALGEDASEIPGDLPLADLLVSSLALVEGMRRIYDRFGVLISIRRVLEGQATLDGLAAYIAREVSAPRTARSETALEDTPSGATTSVRFAPSQHHVGFLTRYSAEASAAFNEAVAVSLQGRLDAPALQAALDRVTERYDALRTSLSPDRNELVVRAHQRLELPIAPCSPAAVDEALTAIVRRPFQPGDRLFRVELLRTSDSEHLLVLVSHALICDLEALELVLDELARFYNEYAENREPESGFPAMQWTDYQAMAQSAGADAARDAARRFWQNAFSGEWPHPELPADHPRPAAKRYTGSRLSRSLAPDLVKDLERVASASGLSQGSVLFGAYATYLARLSGQCDQVIGVRSTPLYLGPDQHVVAQTRNMLPLRLTVNLERGFLENVRECAFLMADADRHRHLSLAEMIQLANQPRDQSRSALFTTAFCERRSAPAPSFGALTAAAVELPAAGARYDLDLAVSSGPDGGVRVTCDFSTELFEPATVERWLDGLLVLLHAGLDAPDTRCASLAMMPDAERHTLLSEWNKTESPYPAGKTLLDLITEREAAFPGAAAIRCGDVEWSYGQLLARVEIIAATLSQHGVKAGDRVAVLLGRSPDLVAALLAAWRTAAAYVPLDPAFPSQRLAYVLDDCRARVCVTSRELAARVPEPFSGAAVVLDAGSDVPAAPVEACVPATATDSAYVIYTSGSTGQPKGVEVRHQALVNCVWAARNLIGFGEGDVLLAVTTPAFDISTAELFMPLAVGGVVDILPDGVVGDGVRLAEVLASRRPNYMQATPSTWKAVLAGGWQGDPGLTVGASGESLSRDLAEQLLTRCRELWNLYGPTETTVWSAACKVHSAPGRPVPIGRPIANTQLYVLDAHREPVAVGAIGELYIGGDGLARGYWRRPDLTAERFVPSPFRTGDHLYRTGDLARYLPDGVLLCLGRTDDQMKIHGVRIEPAEIEAALRKVPGIRDAVVTTWRDSRGDPQLIAHVIPTERTLSAPDVRAQLRELLPDVMIPPHVTFVETFPVTASGKIRRADLPGPAAVSAATDHADAPRTQTERQLTAAWSRVLDLDRSLIGRNAHFLDLGGHSLLMTPLMVEVRRLFGVSFSLREFFDAPTIRSFARLIDERRASAETNQDTASSMAAARQSDWGRQRMATLLHEAQLPADIAPARGAHFQPSAIGKVLITGATGFLGVYILAEILQRDGVEAFCLVRAKRGQDGRARIESQMRRYGAWRDDERWLNAWHQRVHLVEGDVTLPRLGMDASTYEALARDVDAIFHGAAHVNFIYPYEALRATNVLGLHEVLRFAMYARIKQVHHISTAAIWPMGSGQTFYERDPIEHAQMLNLGYDEAKWVAERCLLYAEDRGLPVARYRPGEVGGDSRTGQCATEHFIIASIKGFLQFGAFPILDMELDIAPIDYVARALTYLAFERRPLGRAFHLTNPHRRHLGDALSFLRGQGYTFDEMPFGELRDRLLSSRDFSSNALFPYQAVLQEMDEIGLQLPTYDTTETERELEGSGVRCAPADERLFRVYLDYLRGIGFMPHPDRSPAVI